MSGESDLLVERTDDDIIIATLNRPKVRNTVSFAMWESLGALLTDIEAASPPRAVILQGAESYFCNGGDMKVPPARGSGALNRAKRLEIGQRVIARISALPVPVIAAVEGGAFGLGWGLALACDLLIAGEGAKFGAPFLQFGLAPDGGVAWFLTRQLGRRRASEIIYSGRTVTAREALELGLASKLAADGEVLAAALDFARTMGQGNRHATELTKRMLHHSEDGSLAASQALELATCHQLQSGEELARAREAFIARSAARRQG